MRDEACRLRNRLRRNPSSGPKGSPSAASLRPPAQAALVSRRVAFNLTRQADFANTDLPRNSPELREFVVLALLASAGVFVCGRTAPQETRNGRPCSRNTRPSVLPPAMTAMKIAGGLKHVRRLSAAPEAFNPINYSSADSSGSSDAVSSSFFAALTTGKSTADSSPAARRMSSTEASTSSMATSSSNC